MERRCRFVLLTIFCVVSVCRGQNLAVNEGFETMETTSGGKPGVYGDWNGDYSSIIAGASGGVTPLEGSQMFKFLGTSYSGSGTATECAVFQIIDISGYESLVASGQAVASMSAYFNRVAGDAQTDDMFHIVIFAYDGEPNTFPSRYESQGHASTLAYTGSEPLYSDEDVGTWEMRECELLLPSDTEFIVVGLAASENIYNDSSAPEFDGHFADAVTVEINGSLLAHWKFDDGAGSVAEDSAGDNDGTVYGAVWTDGIIDGALDFDGVDDCVEVPDNDAFTTNKGTISTWIKLNTWGGDNFGRIMCHLTGYTASGDAKGFDWDVRSSEHNLGFCLFNGASGSSRSSAPGSISLNQWYHASIVWDGTTMIAYVNGVQSGDSSAQTINPDNPSTTLVIGDSNYRYWNQFDGLIDDVRFYDVALDANEILQLYQDEIMTYHVDGTDGNDLNDGLTPETAFATIQRGIDEADELDTVVVWPGVYNESGTDGIDFDGKGITVTSAAEPAELVVPGYYAVSFTHGEGAGSILSNFIIRDSYAGVLCSASNPKIKNVTVVNNENGAIGDTGADPNIRNCIFWNNTNGDLYECQASYSYIQDEVEAEYGSPLFADSNSSDYHLMSERGRYWPEHDIWVLDKVTSPCVDGGDPDDDAADEPLPNGGRINMGAYGGTEQGSMSESQLSADLNGDGIVNLLDFAIMADKWMETI